MMTFSDDEPTRMISLKNSRYSSGFQRFNLRHFFETPMPTHLRELIFLSKERHWSHSRWREIDGIEARVLKRKCIVAFRSK